MKHPDYDRAFHQTPDYIRSAIELGFMKGKRRMKARHRLASALTAAAVFLVLLGAGAYGVSRLAAPRPDNRADGAPLSAEARGANVLSAGNRGGQPDPNPAPEATEAPISVTPEPTPEARRASKESTSAPVSAALTATETPVSVTPEPTPTPEAPTPGIDPTPAPMLASEAQPVRLTAYAGGDADPCFHLENPCGGEALPQEMDLDLALREGLAPCPDCVEGRGYRLLAFRADGTGEVAVRDGLWCTERGNYLHVDSNCSGMAGAQKRGIAEAFNSGKRTCPVCMQDWTCAAALDAPEAEAALAHMLDGAPAEYEAAESTPAPVEVEYEAPEPTPAPTPLPAAFEAVEAAPEAEVAPAGEVASTAEPAPEAEAALDVVYYAEEGSYFHRELDCAELRAEEGGSFPAEGSGASGVVVVGGSLMDALRAGKDICPVCLAGWDFVVSAAPAAAEEAQEVVEYEAVRAETIEEEILSVYAADGEGGFFHRSGTCGGEALERELSVGQALGEGLSPCPDCLGEDACTLIAYYEADGSEVSTEALWYTEGGKYFHSSMYCGGMRGAAVHPIADAFASGKSACPKCMEGWTFALRRAESAEPEPTPEPAEVQVEMAKATPAPGEEPADLQMSEPPVEFAVAAPDGSEISVTLRDGGALAISDAEGEQGAIAVSPSGAPYDISHKFYYTPNGKYYHMDASCSGMTGAKRHSAAETAASGKRHCPLCIGDNLSYYWLPAPREDGDYGTPNLYFAEEDAWRPSVWGDAGNVFVPLDADKGLPHYYHINPECFGMAGASMIPWSEAKERGYGPCPACLPVWNSGGSRTICYASEGDALYHADPNCPGVRRARELTQLAAQAEGRLRCPKCGSKDAPAAWTEVRAELGASIASAYPGWSFERADEFEDRTEWFISNGEEAMCAATLRFAEDSESSGNPLRELTLEHGDSATRFFDQSFIESLPNPLSSIQLAADPTQIFSLKLQYQNGQPTSFTAGQTTGRETSYTSWTIQKDGSATITTRN